MNSCCSFVIVVRIRLLCCSCSRLDEITPLGYGCPDSDSISDFASVVSPLARLSTNSFSSSLSLAPEYSSFIRFPEKEKLLHEFAEGGGEFRFPNTLSIVSAIESAVAMATGRIT